MKLTDEIQEIRQIIIEHVTPEIDGGRYPVKRVIGDCFKVEADIFRDGHDLIAAALLYKVVSNEPGTSNGNDDKWQEVPMQPVTNDRWEGEFPISTLGHYRYTIEAWNDRFGTWQHDMAKRVEASQVAPSDVLEGVAIVENTLKRISSQKDRTQLQSLLETAQATTDPVEAGRLFLTEEVTKLMDRYPDRSRAARYNELEITVDPVNARFAAWYELFPRSQSPDPSRTGTLQDVIAQLPRIKGLGFDVLYLPPIHPIGRSNRKGPNNTLNPGPEDPGSPWAIGNENGGHKAIEPSLGTFEDFDQLVRATREHGIALALDFAIQCSPDHPWVKEHPEWFFVRPDGTIKYAENPPKKYQDIYPINFYNKNSAALWEELKSVVLFWIERGVRIFRVDNPHTKPIPFWEWMIGEVKRDYPETVFLAEAFTRPKVMRALAKAGFTQSYTYFTWRNTKWELTEYLTELTQSEMKEYYRGNLWPNTPDILHEFLQVGGIPAFKLRFVLAATLSSVYGMYSGYELGINTPLRHGSEEYLNSDKYQVNNYNWKQPQYLGDFISKINQIRQENRALHLYDNLVFYRADDNQNIIAYGKATPEKDNVILVVVNLNPWASQEAWLGVPYWDWGIGAGEPYRVTDLLTGNAYTWHGEYNFIRLDPLQQPAHIFRVERFTR
ncbi:MAG TPA: alpha-1,4-glucan--maltose-1-phosphate maltosyltransferase [Chloroflexia bacterium]|nr:alpha-1,4-glucan--maltose-1-phosphate maltosyltransferase [Chloroflexia bacterium]